jgi:hypothetical protein
MMNITISNLYDSDYQLWLESTINQLRQGDFQAVDWQNLLESWQIWVKIIDERLRVS